jgi:ABC-type uncharacterized transport system ATPase subunit
LKEIRNPIIKMVNITKVFSNVIADDNVCFELLPGEIHGLLGENGAGKTTLMNILYGLYQPESGEILIDGKSQKVTSPHKAIELGIGMVHQHFMQVSTMTVIDNVIIGLKAGSDFNLDREGARKKILNLCELYGLRVDPDSFIWQLSIGDRQRVEILKALYRDVNILILDEPTSVLTPQETTELFQTIKKLVDTGLSVVFITHKLEEATSITNRVTVMRDGKVVATKKTNETDNTELAYLLVGREVLFRTKIGERENNLLQNDVLRVNNLTVKGDRGNVAVRGVSFTVQAGEIVGIAGVDGNGQSELVQALTGLRHVMEGSFWVENTEFTNASPYKILQHGVGHIPEDLADGIVGELTLIENLMLNRHYKAPYSRYGWMNKTVMASEANALILQNDIRTSGALAKAGTLSGGNKQKLIVAREISRNPSLLIAVHPTRGVDIGAEEFIRNQLIEMRNRNAAILLVSTKLDEIMDLSDRIIVLEKGRIMGQMTRKEASIEKIGLLMAGIDGKHG